MPRELRRIIEYYQLAYFQCHGRIPAMAYKDNKWWIEGHAYDETRIIAMANNLFKSYDSGLMESVKNE